MSDACASEYIEPVCFVRELPEAERTSAAAEAWTENPVNAPPFAFVDATLAVDLEQDALTPAQLAIMTTKWWSSAGRVLTVEFLDDPDAETRRLILAAANTWSSYGNIRFVETAVDGIVRVRREPNDGYWSYLGTDALSVPRGRHTMNLAGFTAATSEATYRRVAVHEFGHACGCPHEHLRREFVNNIDRNAAYAFFARNAGWDRRTVDANVLTPLEDRSIMGSTAADPLSIMCYSLPAEIMRDRRPLVGGAELSPTDKAFFGRVYPLPVQPPPPPRQRRLVIDLPYAGDVSDVRVTVQE